MLSEIYKAILQSVMGRFSVYIVQFFAIVILARVFSPQEFGVIASVQVFVVFFQLITDIGIGPAIINEKEFNEKQRDGVFTVTLILGVLLGIIFYLFSFGLNEFYGNYNYQNIGMVIGISIVFYSLNIVPTTGFNKDVDFISLAKINCLAEIISLFFVYVLYMNNFGVLALASKNLFQSFLRFLLTYFRSSNTSLGRPVFGHEIMHAKNLFGFAKYQFAFNFINYFSRNLDNILVAKYFGVMGLGVYEKAYQLMLYPLMLTTFAVSPAIQPVVARSYEDIDSVVRVHNALAKNILLISLPISVFMYTNADLIVYVLFGEQWLNVVPIVKILSLSIPVQSIVSITGSFFQSVNKPNLLFFSGVISAFFLVSAMFLGVYFHSVIVLVKLLVVAFIVNGIQIYYFLFRFAFRGGGGHFLVSVMTSIFIMIFPCSFYVFVNFYVIGFIVNSWISLIVNIIIGLFFLAPVFFLKNKMFVEEES